MNQDTAIPSMMDEPAADVVDIRGYHKIMDHNNHVISDKMLMIPLPQALTETVLSYVRTRNIYVLCKDLLDGNLLRGGGADKHHCGSLTFDIKRPFAKDATNMHWISPSDDATHQDLLHYLGFTGFGDVLQQFGKYFPHIGKLTCYQLSFIAVSHVHKIRPHADLTCNGNTAWNILFPLKLVEGSTDELMVFSDNKVVSDTVKFHLGTAVVLGDGGVHATNMVDYTGGSFRLMASVYIADISKYNVLALVADVSQKYPNSWKQLMQMTEQPHWTWQSGLSLPTIPVKDWVGRNWYSSFEKVKAFKEAHGHCFITPYNDPSLSEWVYRQRHYYNLMCSCRRAFGMTEERHRLLTSIGFSWTPDRKAISLASLGIQGIKNLLTFTNSMDTVTSSHPIGCLCC